MVRCGYQWITILCWILTTSVEQCTYFVENEEYFRLFCVLKFGFCALSSFQHLLYDVGTVTAVTMTFVWIHLTGQCRKTKISAHRWIAEDNALWEHMKTGSVRIYLIVAVWVFSRTLLKSVNVSVFCRHFCFWSSKATSGLRAIVWDEFEILCDRMQTGNQL